MGNDFDLKSYCFNTTNLSLSEWEKEYKKFLNWLKSGNDEEIKKQEGWKDNWGYVGPYRDPDSYSSVFYRDLAKFLNNQEKDPKKHLNGKEVVRFS